MAVPYLHPSNRDLDYLLEQVTESLQLSKTQYELATEHYTAVADWLAVPDSPLAAFQPRIYPQGSAALGTTVKPRGANQHDVDLVCLLLMAGVSALEIYNLLYDRLRSHALYSGMLEKKNRCSRLNYTGNFHLDIIPAIPDFVRADSAIWVPDRELRALTPSNPKGFLLWFRNRAQAGLFLEGRETEPLPEQEPVAAKTTLAVAVQLIKRRRDMMFSSPDDAPRSILLTTLAGHHYLGGECLATTVLEIMTGIRHQIEDALPNRIVVCNPTNQGEKFCESFTPESYEKFRYFVITLEREMQTLLLTQGIPELRRLLVDMFGEEPGEAAVKAYGEQLRGRRDAGSLPFTGSGRGGIGIIAGPSAGATVPKHSYFGR